MNSLLRICHHVLLNNGLIIRTHSSILESQAAVLVDHYTVVRTRTRIRTLAAMVAHHIRTGAQETVDDIRFCKRRIHVVRGGAYCKTTIIVGVSTAGRQLLPRIESRLGVLHRQGLWIGIH